MFDKEVYKSIQMSIRSLHNTADELHDAAKAFHTTGNTKMGDNLTFHAKNIDNDARHISDMIGVTLGVNFEDSMNQIAKTLDARQKK